MTDKKKIIIICRNLYSGGAERVVSQLANYFQSNNNMVSIITIDDMPVMYKIDSNIKLIAVGKKANNKLIDKIRRYYSVRKIVTKIKPDRVLSLPEDIAVYVILSLLGTRIKIYVSERNNPWVMPNVKITRVLRILMYPFVDGIIFQTEYAKSYFSKNIQKKGIVLPNPVDASRIPNRYDGIREKTIVSIGRLSEQKNFPLLINAFREFSLNNPEYKLIIYGEGIERKRLEKMIFGYGLEKKVLMPGRSENVLNRIREAGMFVLTSNYEGLPNVLIEAMCMGMPVISTDCPSGGPAELIIDGKNGFLIPVGDTKGLVNAMHKITDENVAKKISDNAFQMREKFTNRDVFNKWENFLLN